MITSTVNLDGLNKGIAGLINKLGLQSRVVLKKESGEIVKTLVRITPPKEPAKTRERIGKRVNRRFQQLDKSGGDFEALDSKTSASGVKWYAASSQFLYGGLPDNDMRKADDSAMLQIFFRSKTIQNQTRIVLPLNRNTRQRAAIMTRIIAKREQINRVMRRIRNRVGRLKAGWFGASGDLWRKLAPTGANMPPQWVSRHMNGSRGYHIDLLSDSTRPRLIIGNTAAGVGNPRNNMAWLVQNAATIRAKAIAVNIGLYLSGKKKLSDYAK